MCEYTDGWNIFPGQKREYTEILHQLKLQMEIAKDIRIKNGNNERHKNQTTLFWPHQEAYYNKNRTSQNLKEIEQGEDVQ